MLVLQQPTLKTGALASAIASSCRSGPKNPPSPRGHPAIASRVRHRRHDVDAMAATPAGSRRAMVGYRAEHRDNP